MMNKMLNNGFVEGTLVHTKEGLIPIEQIKVGDYVLSKPESGEGEAGYQQVTQTYEYEDRAIYFVAWAIQDIELHRKNPEEYYKLIKRGYVVVTGEHPFWVKQMTSLDEETCQRVIHEVNAWMSVEAMIQLKRKLIEEHGDLGYGFRIELTDGRCAGLVYYQPILQHRELNYGITFDPEEWDLLGVAVRFTQEGPVATRNEHGFYDQDILFEDDALEYDYDDEDAFITQTMGFLPMCRKVYNLKLEDHHTYFVDTLGALVHDANLIES